MNEKKYDTTVNFMVKHAQRDMVRAESRRRWREGRADWREADVMREWLDAGASLGAGSRVHNERLAIYEEVKAEREAAQRRAARNVRARA